MTDFVNNPRVVKEKFVGKYGNGRDEITEREFELAIEISKRASLLYRESPFQFLMDLCICNANGTPLDFEAFANAETADFKHDIEGINANLSHITGELENNFVPRFALKVTVN